MNAWSPLLLLLQLVSLFLPLGIAQGRSSVTIGTWTGSWGDKIAESVNLAQRWWTTRDGHDLTKQPQLADLLPKQHPRHLHDVDPDKYRPPILRRSFSRRKSKGYELEALIQTSNVCVSFPRETVRTLSDSHFFSELLLSPPCSLLVFLHPWCHQHVCSAVSYLSTTPL